MKLKMLDIDRQTYYPLQSHQTYVKHTCTFDHTAGDIRKKDKFRLGQTCQNCHAGLCITKDEECWPDLSLARDRLFDFVKKNAKKYPWLILSSMVAEGPPNELFAYVAVCKDQCSMCVLMLAELVTADGDDNDLLVLRQDQRGESISFTPMYVGTFVKMGFENQPPKLLKLVVQCVTVQDTERCDEVIVTGVHAEAAFDLYDHEKKLDAPAAKPKKKAKGEMPADVDAAFASWFASGMDALGAAGEKGVASGGGGPACGPENSSSGESSSSTDTDSDDSVKLDRVMDGIEADHAKLATLIPEWLPHRQADGVDVGIMEHVFLWITRSSRQATCRKCKGPILRYTFRLVYNPHPTEMGPSKQWNKVLWRYFHLSQGCLGEVFERMMMVPSQCSTSCSSTGSASFIARKGWRLTEDVAPLPQREKETAEARRAATAAAVEQLNSHFAALDAATPTD